MKYPIGNKTRIKRCVYVHSVILTLLFLLPLCSLSQTQDAWQWTTLGIEKKINKKWSAEMEEEIRLFDNMTRLNLCYTNLGVSYKLNKHFKFAGVYRFLQKSRPDGSFSFRHRIYFDVSYKYGLGKFDFTYRARFQSQMRDIYSSEKGRIPETYWRSKFDIKYDAKHSLKPYISAEFRYEFGNLQLPEANYAFNRGRYYMGCEYDLNSKNSFELYYMIQHEFNINDPETDYVAGIAYHLSL